MTPDELQIPPTEIELAELLTAAGKPDHQLTQAGIDVLRRLMFAYSRAKGAAHEYLMETNDAYVARYGGKK